MTGPVPAAGAVQLNVHTLVVELEVECVTYLVPPTSLLAVPGASTPSCVPVAFCGESSNPYLPELVSGFVAVIE